MQTAPSSRSFSLLEVMIAVALFAGSVTVILALLLPLSRLGTQQADHLAAQRLPGALHLELARLSASAFDALAAEVPLMGAPPAGGLGFVATRDGARLHSRDYRPPTAGEIPEDERYFLVECWRFPDGALQFSSGQNSLVLVVRVSWPQGGTAAVPEPQELMFITALNR